MKRKKINYTHGKLKKLLDFGRVDGWLLLFKTLGYTSENMVAYGTLAKVQNLIVAGLGAKSRRPVLSEKRHYVLPLVGGELHFDCKQLKSGEDLWIPIVTDPVVVINIYYTSSVPVRA